ncbi:antiterminator Q family protein [Kosakonia cowanii]|uniref:antiterminator Q family protein n=1 Tax=Kosakonia cowanii TaxID=208223 RepID=UPI0028AACC0E|nr:antiterminator Q family protein [Kosakonia cowanii]
MRDIQMVLERWGGWAASDNSGVDYSPIAAGFKGLIPHTSKTRLSCSDDDALVIEGCLARLQKKRPYEHSLLVAYYLLGISKRKIAKARKKDERLVRIEIQMAEGFIEGCLSMLDVKLELDV